MFTEPQTWYEVQVRGVSGGREGEMGVRGVHTLPPADIPSLNLAPPTNLEATPQSPFIIYLTWVPPAQVNVSYFTVCYRVVPSSVAIEDTFANFLNR